MHAAADPLPRRARGDQPDPWEVAPRAPGVPDGEVFVYRSSLDVGEETRSRLRSHLSGEEMRRASRLRAPLDAERFVAGRGLLREILSLHVGIAPAELPIEVGRRGKPFLDPGATGRRLEFNVAHTDDLALFAIGGTAAVGVDVERVRPLHDLADLIRRSCAPGELSGLGATRGSARNEAFLDLWTRKEALLKGMGVGLAQGLAHLDTTRPPEGWALVRLRPRAGFVATLAVREAGARARCLVWTPD